MKIIITTPNIYLRESTVEDATLAYELNLDPDVIRYTGDPSFVSIEEARAFLQNYDAFEKYGMGRWYAFLRRDNAFIGWCGLKYSPESDEVDIGYRLLRKYWGKGYATEAAKYCLEFGFNELGIEEIVARADSRNIGSIRVMEKIGMEYDKEMEFDGHLGITYKAKKDLWIK